MEQVIDILAVVGVIVTVVLFWLGGGRAIYWWLNPTQGAQNDD